MNANKLASPRSMKSDLSRVDAHAVKPEEYDELPELTEDMLARAKVNKGGRPLSPNPRKLKRLRAERIEGLKAVHEKLRAEPLLPMTPEDIQAKIDAYRTEQRRAAFLIPTRPFRRCCGAARQVG